MLKPSDVIFDHPAQELAEDIISLLEASGRDAGRLITWYEEFFSSNSFEEALAERWRATKTPLAQFADHIERVGLYRSPTSHSHGHVGIGVLLDHGQFSVLVQEPPLDRELVIKHLSANMTISPPEVLVDLFSNAPGFVNANNRFLACADYIFNPLESFARDQSGPNATYNDCWLNDVAVWPKDSCAFELFIIESSGLRRCWIIIGKDGTPYYYRDEVTDALIEFDLAIDELVHELIARPPAKLVSLLNRKLKKQGRRIEFVRYGDPIRSEFDSIPREIQLIFVYAVTYRLLIAEPWNPIYDEAIILLKEIRDVLSSRKAGISIPLKDRIEAIADEAVENMAAYSNKFTEVCELMSKLTTAINDKSWPVAMWPIASLPGVRRVILPIYKSFVELNGNQRQIQDNQVLIKQLEDGDTLC